MQPKLLLKYAILFFTTENIPKSSLWEILTIRLIIRVYKIHFLASPYSSDSTNIHPYKLYNLFSNIHYFQGTHRYQGVWNQLDQIIVNGSLLEPSSPFHLVPQTNKIFSPKFLFIHDKTYHGERPFCTYYGFKYEGGFSDHLPILADFDTLH